MSQFCTWHDSRAVGTCAKLWPDCAITIKSRANKYIFRKFISWAHKRLVKWSHVHNSYKVSRQSKPTVAAHCWQARNKYSYTWPDQCKLMVSPLQTYWRYHSFAPTCHHIQWLPIRSFHLKLHLCLRAIWFSDPLIERLANSLNIISTNMSIGFVVPFGSVPPEKRKNET